ncbi:hypothetical protein AALO_G00102990, partial [Alosa alosa]
MKMANKLQGKGRVKPNHPPPPPPVPSPQSLTREQVEKADQTQPDEKLYKNTENPEEAQVIFCGVLKLYCRGVKLIGSGPDMLNCNIMRAIIVMVIIIFLHGLECCCAAVIQYTAHILLFLQDGL